MKCLEIARLKDFAPNTPGLLGVAQGPQTPCPEVHAQLEMHVDEPPSGNSCLRACVVHVIYISFEDVRVWDGLGMGVVVLYMLSIFLGKSVGLSCSQQEIRDHNKQYVYDKCNLHYI